jgi:hypothetical protein
VNPKIDPPYREARKGSVRERVSTGSVERPEQAAGASAPLVGDGGWGKENYLGGDVGHFALLKRLRRHSAIEGTIRKGGEDDRDGQVPTS